MMPIMLGVALAVVIAISARWMQFDRDRSFYPTVLIVIASYYLLFACMAGQAVFEEALVALAFTAAALLAAFYWPLGVGVGIALHGVFDILHDGLIDNPGVPIWWPAFCAAVDITLGFWLVVYSRRAPLSRQ